MANKKLSDYEWTCLWAALRYFCGRETIASATFPANVIENAYKRLSDDQKKSLAKNVLEYFEMCGRIGHKQIDQPHWLKFAAALDDSQHILVLAKDQSTHVCFRVGEKVYPLESYLSDPDREIYLPEENIEAVII